MIREAVGRVLSMPGGTVSTVPMMPPSVRVAAQRRRGLPPVALLVTGWLLFAVALGIGVLVGRAIWG